tara:strand:- start:14031 stop:14495 length:465 start_codon:yes stop_codon:yes gene_type:complete
MKIRITVGDDQKLSGYTNIDPITKFDDLSVDIRDLDEVVSDAECMEILSDDVIDYLEKEESMRVISHWAKKLRHGGKIIVTSIDAHEVARSFYRKEIDVQTFNKAIHGSFTQPWDVRLSQTTLEELSSFLESNGLQVTKKRINGIKLVVEAERP